MTLGVQTWTKNKNAVSVNYGPLWFSLAIGERWSRFEGTDKWPGWEVFPTTPWNYGLVLDEKAPAKSFEMLRSTAPLPPQPFTPGSVPIELRAKARKIPHWTLNGRGLIGTLQPSPARSDEPLETVTLIPMGAARLRIAAFPTIGAGPGCARLGGAAGLPDFRLLHLPKATRSTLPASSQPRPPVPTRPACRDSLGGRTAGRPSGCNTTSCRRGRFPPRKSTGSTTRPKGGCRVPASWRLLYKDGDAWKPVEGASAYGNEAGPVQPHDVSPGRDAGAAAGSPTATGILRRHAAVEDQRVIATIAAANGFVPRTKPDNARQCAHVFVRGGARTISARGRCSSSHRYSCDRLPMLDKSSKILIMRDGKFLF